MTDEENDKLKLKEFGVGLGLLIATAQLIPRLVRRIDHTIYYSSASEFLMDSNRLEDARRFVSGNYAHTTLELNSMVSITLFIEKDQISKTVTTPDIGFESWFDSK